MKLTTNKLTGYATKIGLFAAGVVLAGYVTIKATPVKLLSRVTLLRFA